MKAEKQTKAQAELAHAIASRRREIENERAAIQKRIDATRPEIRVLAATGTRAQRELARRWLALDRAAQKATA